ncbi:MAG: hypothetical protein RJA99_1571 [Pseudomonadota bacterium]|jgi:hypothetical protein
MTAGPGRSGGSAGGWPGGRPPRRWDLCNGDADGLCALHQWRLSHPDPAATLTGLKRDIELLRHVPDGAADEVNVFDLSMRRNRTDLLRLLADGARVRWFDHHAAPPLPDSPRLEAHLDDDPRTCTSLLVDRALGGAHRGWALVGAYGDGLGETADALAAASGCDAAQRAALRRLGEAMNYNAYGERESDVVVAPARLLERMAGAADPLRFAHDAPEVDAIDRQRRQDLARVAGLAPHWRGARGCVWMLPDAPWSRRAIGPLATALAEADPGRAHAVLRDDGAGGYVASVRAPRAAPQGAAAFCERFGGSGRAAAAGIDRLPAAGLDRFVAAFADAW